jgi:hypothetical protein
VRIEKRRPVSIDGRATVLELEVTGTEFGVIGVTVETEHAVPLRFDPVDAVVLVVDPVRIPEPYFQTRMLDAVGSPRNAVESTAATTYRGRRRDGR